MPNSVTPSMPLNTARPSERRIPAPAPSAITKGTTPKMKANEVSRIGRRRSRTASSVASRGALPSSRCCLANSTMRMAFLLARPTSTTKPICVKMFTSIRARVTPTMEQSRHIGTTRMTASGSDQLSYWAASTRNTATTDAKKAKTAVLPACSSRNASSLHSAFMPGRNSRLASSAITARPSPELTPRAAVQALGPVHVDVQLRRVRPVDVEQVGQLRPGVAALHEVVGLALERRRIDGPKGRAAVRPRGAGLAAVFDHHAEAAGPADAAQG